MNSISKAFLLEDTFHTFFFLCDVKIYVIFLHASEEGRVDSTDKVSWKGRKNGNDIVEVIFQS